ncbi:MAG: L,D-transpeptidase scaffold domain-containing protein, partial [Caulobacteraceae bacterium]
MTGIFAAVADAQTAPAATTARPYVAPATAAKPPVAAVASPPKPTPPPAPISLTDEQAQLLLDALGQAESHGLESRSTAIAQIAEAFASRNPQARQTAEARLVTLTLDYAREIRSGRLKRELFMDKWGLKPPPYDPRPSFVQAVAQNRVGAWLDDQPPPYAGYQDLRGGLATYRAIQAKGGWQAIPAGPAMKLGATGPRVAALRARLAAEDAAVTPQGQAVFDQALADAVIRAQKRFGMAPDGEVGEPTLAALNSPVQRRIDQIVANMER